MKTDCINNENYDVLAEESLPVPPKPRPCNLHPCGLNAQCNDGTGSAQCTCPAGYLGDPYQSCRPECSISSECSRDQSCIAQRCVDPCAGVCGLNSDCRVANHIPICSCSEGYNGDPYNLCRPIPVTSKSRIKLVPQFLVSNRNSILI